MELTYILTIKIRSWIKFNFSKSSQIIIKEVYLESSLLCQNILEDLGSLKLYLPQKPNNNGRK